MISVTKLLFAREYAGDRLRYTHSAQAMKNGAAAGMGPVVVWNSTRTCNLHCCHCYMDSDARAYEDELTTEEAKKFMRFSMSKEGQQILFDPKISRLPILPYSELKPPPNYPNPQEVAKRAKV